MDVDRRRGPRAGRIRPRLVGHAAEPAAARRPGGWRRRSRRKPRSNGMRPAGRSSPPHPAPIWPSRPVMPTRRIGSSRWICRGGSRPENCPRSSAPLPSKPTPARDVSVSARWPAASSRRRPRDERAVVEAYTRGVNAGLHSLRARPWEYLLLRASPRDWLPEDSVLVVHSMWWQLQYGSITAELDRRRLERAAAASATPAAAQELISFVYAGHSEWDTPNYSADAPCVQAACTESARVLTQPFPALLRFAAAPAADGQERGQARQQQLGGRRHPHPFGNRAHRQRHAPRPGCSGGVVSGAAARHRRHAARHHRRHLAGHAGGGRRFERAGGLGLHQQLRRFLRRALGQVCERRFRRASRTHPGARRRRRGSRIPRRGRGRAARWRRHTPTMSRAASVRRWPGSRPARRRPTSGC